MAGITETVELIPKRRMNRCFSDPSLVGLSRHIIDLEDCGPISVYIQGDLETSRSGPVYMTIHNVGGSFHSMVDFVNHPDMEEVKSRSLFLHVSVFGQNHKAEDLTMLFPSLKKIGMGLVTVLDELKIKDVVVIGDGAGANIALRFGVYHPTRTAGLVLINCSASEKTSSVMEMIMAKIMGPKVTEEEPTLNTNNLQKYLEAFNNRTSMVDEVHDRINFDVLLLNGSESTSCEDSELIYSKIVPGKASIIKIADVTDPLRDAPEKVADPLILLSQGLGWIPTVKRKMSVGKVNKLGSMENIEGEHPPLARRISMEQYDTPNVRRFSLDKH